MDHWSYLTGAPSKTTLVLTYKSNPYKYSANAANITSSVVRIVITDRRGNDVRLYDLQDQLTTTMDLSQVLSGNTEWIDMNHNGEEWKLVAHTNLSVEAMVVDIKLKSRYDCTLYGLFGWTGYPSRRSYNIKVVTRGDNKIVRKSPWSLPLFYKDSELQITIYNTEFIDGGYIPPLLMTVKCQEIHQYRVLDLESYYLENDDWSKSNKARVYSVQGTNVVIKNSFFGTFAANSLFIPPSPIDFDKIFENFLERLTSTPHVLVAIIIVLLVTIPVNVFLRRADKEDHYRWLYLPLIDNGEGETCMYFLSIYTAVRSSRFLTSHCYFNLKGESSTTGDRILSDGCRQNFTRGTCCNFLLTTKQELGQLQKITVWHDNKGNNPNWLLSKIVIEDALTREK
ncbi:polycystin-1-like protein 3 [Saccostrea cucullata]|uniref:polycystin-1-like protein 3 n=1 Tax=Saccostrea cuccullata TaxID=36930 RepID=UPI002ED2C7F6